jgi:hypothetical protein
MNSLIIKFIKLNKLSSSNEEVLDISRGGSLGKKCPEIELEEPRKIFGKIADELSLRLDSAHYVIDADLSLPVS